MATCSKCGKRIGLLEYVSAVESRRGLCKECRTERKLCYNCIHYLKLSDVLGKPTVARCLKYGYDLSNQKNHVTAGNCPFFSTTLPPKKTEKPKEEKTQVTYKRKTGNNQTKMSQTPEEFWTHFEDWKKKTVKENGQ